MAPLDNENRFRRVSELRRALRLEIFLLAILAALAPACSRSTTPGKKLIVLGVDGMDPNFVERHWDALPNLDSLRKQGDFKRLRTTTPPQSPVAWSTFITGMDPAVHGILDFVHRDPATLALFSSMSTTEEPKHTLSFGSYVIPLSKARVLSLRHGRAFWEILSDHHVPATVIRMPANYPPIEAGQALAGMGTPDLRGTQGTFTLYTDDPEEISRPVPGGRIVKVPSFRDRTVLSIEGPPNSLRKGQPFVAVDLVVDRDPENAAARFTLGDSVIILRQGEWSGWLLADFTLLRGLASARGMIRLYAKQLHPRFEIYVSPVNVDPRSPELPISAPSHFSRELASEVGPFYTQGIAEDTSALREGALNLPEFRAQSRLVFEDERRLLGYSLRHYREGLLFFYFSTLDQNSHMLWGKHEPELLAIYRDVDAAIGEVMRARTGADLIVMSDHGFTSFERSVNLNTLLWKQGFLSLQGQAGAGTDEQPFSGFNWPETQVYAVGLNGLYLNLAGREKEGVVKPGGDAQALLAKVRAQLLSFRDPQNGRPVVEDVYVMPAAGTTSGAAPDMIVGYSPGYRGSWQTALGQAAAGVVDDNTDLWIADHCINAADVPGVLFSNRKIRDPNPALKDLTVSILSLFGLAPGAGMNGTPVF